MALLATLLKVVMTVILPPLAVFLEAGACARGGERGGPGGREERGRGRGAPAPVTRGEMRGGAPHLPSCRASTLTAPAPPPPPPPPPLSGLRTQFCLHLLLTLLGWLPGTIHALWIIFADRGL
jgi:uncharacterized membrane protein YqaE (UPF0057 family)